MKRLNQIRRQLQRAKQVLALYDSPIPDAHELRIRTEQQALITRLENQLIQERIAEDREIEQRDKARQRT